jgi:predicted permease
MHTLVTAIRVQVRTFVREPGFACTAVLTLALGIGATTALFTVVNAVLLEPLPFPQSARLVQIWRSELPRLTFGSASVARYVDWRERQRAFTDLGAWAPQGMTLGGGGGPERVNGAAASASFFRVLGGQPALGRWFSDEEDRPGAPRVAVISIALWQRRFGGAADALGATIVIDGQPHVVVGVTSAGLDEVWRREVWVPLAREVDQAQRGRNFMLVFGRLRDGTDVDQARRSLDAMAVELGRDYPIDRYTFTVWRLHDVITDGSRRGLWVLLGATGLLLLIACVNVSNLLLARAVARERDLAVRASLGASRTRLVALVVGETLTIALAGSAAGLAAAWALVRAFVSLAPANFPRLANVGIDARVLGFAILIAVAAGVAAALAPAIHLVRTDLNSTLRAGQSRGATAGRARAASRALVVSEIALALALLTTAALMVKSLWNLLAQDLGVTSAPVLTFAVGLTPEAAEDQEGVTRFVTDFESRLRALPGATHVGAISMLPIAATGFNSPVSKPDEVVPEERQPLSELRVVTPGYFDAMGMRIVAGRALNDRDVSGAPGVVVVNEALAAALWPGTPAAGVVGERMRAGWDSGNQFRVVAGVVSDVRSRRPENPPAPEAYAPVAQVPTATMTYVVRSAGDPVALTATIRAALAEIDPGLPLAAVRTFGDVRSTATRTASLTSWLSTLFGLLAAALAMLGIYSVMSYTIAQRERELAIRAAVGATRRTLLAIVLREGLTLGAVGLAIGLAFASAGSRALGSLLYGVSATDPAILIASAAALAVVALAGYLLPAARASRVDPVAALRD